MLGPCLRGNRALLREPREGDLGVILAWHNDPEVRRYTRLRWLRDWVPSTLPPDLDEMRRWLRGVVDQADGVTWTVEVDGKVVGAAGIRDIDRLTATARTHTVIGDRGRWGRGIATEVVGLRARYAFEVLQLRTLRSSTLAENIAMQRVLLKNGYRHTGIRHGDYVREGVAYDSWTAELRSHWLGHRFETVNDAFAREREPSADSQSDS